MKKRTIALAVLASPLLILLAVLGWIALEIQHYRETRVWPSGE